MQTNCLFTALLLVFIKKLNASCSCFDQPISSEKKRKKLFLGLVGNAVCDYIPKTECTDHGLPSFFHKRKKCFKSISKLP